jgi:hypothetical protein
VAAPRPVPLRTTFTPIKASPDSLSVIAPVIFPVIPQNNDIGNKRDIKIKISRVRLINFPFKKTTIIRGFENPRIIN